MKTCSVVNCGRGCRCRGLCGMHYQRVMKYGDVGPAGSHRAAPVADAEDFFSRTTERGGCLEWSGVTDASGYGRCGDSILAHRMAWEFTHGPIPAGLHVCHHCDNPPCVNPEHLFVGTHQDNMRDRDAKGRQPRGERMGGARLTADAVRHIRSTDEPGILLAEFYGVAQETISSARHWRSWRHIGECPPAIARQKRLREEDVVAIRRRLSAGERQLALAEEYGVTQPSISNIATGSTWKHAGERHGGADE
jgi:hypothetical protein